MLILGILAFGMISGWLAQLVLGMGTRPNAQSLIAGIAGSFVGGLLASLIAGVVTGGDVDANTMVTEEYLMTLERKAFCSLLTHPKTQERIMGMLSTGKPVRN